MTMRSRLALLGTLLLATTGARADTITLKRSVRNLAGAGKGDRKWQRSKLPQVDAWLRGAVGVVAREASRAGRIDAEEFLEDFLFAYGTVADAEEA